MTVRPRRSSGFVLVAVLFFVLLLSAGIATFQKRALMDALIARNRENAARASALARGGIQVAIALLLEDRLRQVEGELSIDGPTDVWAKAGTAELPIDEDSRISLSVQDVGSLLNLNAVLNAFGGKDEQGDDGRDAGEDQDKARVFLVELIEKAIEDLAEAEEIPPGDLQYDPKQLADNLLDFADPDDVRQSGGPEDAYYQEQSPPYRAWNKPLVSLSQLRLIEGFDARLVSQLEQYLTVHPFAGRTGINVNTAPAHVLALLFRLDGSDYQLVDEETVKQILEIRAKGTLICGEGGSKDGSCVALSSIPGLQNAPFPPPTYSTDYFEVKTRARVGDVTREVAAIVDRSDPVEPTLLSFSSR
jgi:general secretion pathway protein K